MRRVLSIVGLLWLAALHIGLVIACCSLTGCQQRPRHVDYREAPRREYYLPHYYQEPRPRLEREA